MGIATAALIAEKLIADGLAPDTSVAILERGSLPNSRAMHTWLADLGDAVLREKVKSPALLIVGDVAALGLGQNLLSHIRQFEESMA
jgi:uroporphyrin-III C-methyltransferase